MSDPSTFSVPGPETVGVIAAIALMITGAYFLVGTEPTARFGRPLDPDVGRRLAGGAPAPSAPLTKFLLAQRKSLTAEA